MSAGGVANGRRSSAERVTNDELASALDEQFGMLAEQADRIEALHERMRRTEGHIRRMVETNERLLKERQTFLEALGWQRLRDVGAPTRPLPPQAATPEDFEPWAQADLDRFLRELRAG